VILVQLPRRQEAWFHALQAEICLELAEEDAQQFAQVRFVAGTVALGDALGFERSVRELDQFVLRVKLIPRTMLQIQSDRSLRQKEKHPCERFAAVSSSVNA
jgi:hypothetical protein